MSANVITNVEMVRELIAQHCAGFGSHPASTIRRVRFDELTSEEVSILNDWIENHAISLTVDPNVPGMLELLLGLRECQPGEAPFRTSGGKSFFSETNADNRLKSDSRIKPIGTEGTYSNLMARGLWGFNIVDPIIFCERFKCLSGQHRLDGMVEARDKGYKLPMVRVLLAYPWQFKDLLDKQKARKKADDNLTDENIVPIDAIRLTQLHLSGETTDNAKGEARKERASIIAIRSKVAGMIFNRSQGREIATTGDKLSYRVEASIASRLGQYSIEPFTATDPNSGETVIDLPGVDCLSLDYLSIRIWELSDSAKRAWAKYLFAPSVLTACLILASNDEESVQSRLAGMDKLPGETPEEFADRVEAERLALVGPDSPIAIDWQLVQTVEELFSQSTIECDKNGKVQSHGGPLGEVFANLANDAAKFKSNTPKYIYKPMSIGAMSACVQLIKNIRAGDYSSSVFTKYTPNREGDYSPVYRCFGGLDVGYTEESKAKKGRKKAE